MKFTIHKNTQYDIYKTQKYTVLQFNTTQKYTLCHSQDTNTQIHKWQEEMHIVLALHAVAAFSTSILQYTEIHNNTTLEYTNTQLHKWQMHIALTNIQSLDFPPLICINTDVHSIAEGATKFWFVQTMAMGGSREGGVLDID